MVVLFKCSGFIREGTSPAFAGRTNRVVLQSSQNIIDTKIYISYSLRSSDNDFEMIGKVDFMKIIV